MNETRSKILVIGAGFGGMIAMLRLAGKTRRQNVEITLVNASDNYIERLHLHEWVTNPRLINSPIVAMLRETRVAYLQGKVTAIEARQRTAVVQTQSGEQRLVYDYLVYALGSTIDMGKIPGVNEYAYSLIPHRPRSSVNLQEVLPALAKSGARVVVGG